MICPNCKSDNCVKSDKHSKLIMNEYKRNVYITEFKCRECESKFSYNEEFFSQCDIKDSYLETWKLIVE
jgi:hypothetical protein